MRALTFTFPFFSNKQLRASVIIAVALLSLMLMVQSVHAAFSYNTVALANYSYVMPDNQSLTHSSGRFMYAVHNYVAETIQVFIYRTDGTLEASPSVTSETAADLNDISSICIGEINSTYIIVGFATTNPATNDLQFKAYVLQIFTYIWTQSNYLNVETTTATYYIRLSEWHEATDGFYIGYDASKNIVGAANWFGVLKYDTAANTVSEVYEVDSAVQEYDQASFVGSFYNSTYNMLFYMCAELTAATPQYYAYDVAATTGELLASHPVANHTDASRYGHFIDGGVKVSGTNVIVYFTWIHSYVDGTTRHHRFVQHRLIFNQTIEAAELLQQNERYQEFTPNLSGGAARTWILGYGDTYQNYTIYYPVWSAVESTHLIMNNTLYVSDWLNYGISTVDIESSNEDDSMPLRDISDLPSRNFASQFMTIEDQTTDCRIYYGLEAAITNYDVTLSYLPLDDPLVVNTAYLFTSQVFLNGFGHQVDLIILLDNGQVDATETSSNGVHTFGLTIGVAGYHTLTFNVYEGAVLEYIEEFTLLWIDTTQEYPTTGVMLPQTMALITYMLPVLCIILVPSVGFHRVAGLTGALLGATLGVVICALAGFLPFYAVFLLILVIAIGFIFIIRSGGSSGGGVVQ